MVKQPTHFKGEWRKCQGINQVGTVPEWFTNKNTNARPPFEYSCIFVDGSLIPNLSMPKTRRIKGRGSADPRPAGHAPRKIFGA